jgi:hypothetical protein
MTSPELKYEYLFEMGGSITGPYQASDECAIYPIPEDWFEGPKLKGKIIHGGNWLWPPRSAAFTLPIYGLPFRLMTRIISICDIPEL